MELIRQGKVSIKNKQIISIFDLGNQASDMLTTWKKLKESNIQISIKEFPVIDFTQMIEDKQLIELILEFALQIEINKKLVAKQRQAKGIEEARKKGIKLGRKEKVIPENFVELYEQVLAKKITMKKATEILDVDYKTYRKWVKRYRERK